MFGALLKWFTQSGHGDKRDERAPLEAIFLRFLGIGYLVVFVISSAITRPHPGLHGRGLGILVAVTAFVISAAATQPRRGTASMRMRIALLGCVIVASAVLAALQPSGIWQAGPYFVGVVAAMRLERVAGMLTLAVCLLVLGVVTIAAGHGSSTISVMLGAVPWFLVMRLMRQTRDQHMALEASRAAQAQAAIAAERGRMAREMHDVLAHSLSALALQLESTRLLAGDRGVDADVTRALQEAHHLAAGGLEEARRAIATARGDELPGPERLDALTQAFGQQSGLSVALEVNGSPRELPPEASLAIYRTAQEALTNIRRHAAAERVDIHLDYREEATVLVVEDLAAPGTPPPVAITNGGYGLTGMRERAELIGGRLLAEPTAQGFRVELWLPATAGVPQGAR